MKNFKHSLRTYFVLVVGAGLLVTAACAKKSSGDSDPAPAPAPAATQNATSVQKCGVGISYDAVTNQCLPLLLDNFTQTTFIAQYDKSNPRAPGELDPGNGNFHARFGIESMKICNQDKWDDTGLNCPLVFKNSTIEIKVILEGNPQQTAFVSFDIGVGKNKGEQSSVTNNLLLNPVYSYWQLQQQQQLPNYAQYNYRPTTPFYFKGLVTKYTGEARIPGPAGQVIIENRPDSDGFLVVPDKMSGPPKSMEDMVLLVKKGSPRDPKLEFMFVHPDNFNHNWMSGKMQNCNLTGCN